jgi:GTP-binding protein Era
LLNHLIGTKVSITSRKAQTTRHRILGVKTTDQAQFIFVDTPGFQNTHRNQLNRAMNRFVDDAVSTADVVVHMVEASGLKNEDALVESRFDASIPVVLVLSKIDRVKNQNDLLPLMAQVAARRSYAAIIPVSAKSGKGVDQLLAEIARHLPEAAPIYDADAFTDRSERFLAAELIREKVFRLSGEEVPYGCDVTIEKFQEEGALRRIHATIIVERAGHKAILLGSKGEKMKRIATEARLDMEKLFGSKVFLELWVKVKGGWADSDAMLKSLGYR